jgi:hypothetical protein
VLGREAGRVQQVGRQSWRSHGVLVSTPVPSHTHALGFEKITQILAVIERVRVWRLEAGASFAFWLRLPSLSPQSPLGRA